MQIPIPTPGKSQWKSVLFGGLMGGISANGTTLVQTNGGDVTLGRDNITDRVRLELTSLSQAANIGQGDFTIEMWLRPYSSTYNQGPAATTGAGTSGGTSGNIFFDRDYLPSTSNIGWGLSLAAGRVTAWIRGRTVTGTSDLRDNQWHFIQFLRDNTNGVVRIRVDGTEEVSDTNSAYIADIRYDPASPGTTGPATYSNPWQVLGAEKHDYSPGAGNNPSYFGYIADVRLSDNLRSNTQPTAPMVTDQNAVWQPDFSNVSGMSIPDKVSGGTAAEIVQSSEGLPRLTTLTPY